MWVFIHVAFHVDQQRLLWIASRGDLISGNVR
jgi:hypothetical protein